MILLLYTKLQFLFLYSGIFSNKDFITSENNERELACILILFFFSLIMKFTLIFFPFFFLSCLIFELDKLNTSVLLFSLIISLSIKLRKVLAFFLQFKHKNKYD